RALVIVQIVDAKVGENDGHVVLRLEPLVDVAQVWEHALVHLRIMKDLEDVAFLRPFCRASESWQAKGIFAGGVLKVRSLAAAPKNVGSPAHSIAEHGVGFEGRDVEIEAVFQDSGSGHSRAFA